MFHAHLQFWTVETSSFVLSTLFCSICVSGTHFIWCFSLLYPVQGPQVFLAVPSRHMAQPKHRLFVFLPLLIFDQHLLRFAKRAVESERGWKEWGLRKRGRVYSGTPQMKSAAVAKMPLG